MADRTRIEWADATWNPIVGCSVVSPGCTNCYAMRLAGTRLRHHPSRAGLTRESKAGPVWTGDVRLHEPALDQPLKWRRPRRIFVCAHGDLFAEQVPDEWIDRVFAVMALAPQHTFLVLTKRAKRMREYFLKRQYLDVHPLEDRELAIDRAMNEIAPAHWCQRELQDYSEDGLPLPNVWLGVSVEDQQRADERIPDLLATPATKRFISAEPLIGPVDLTNIGGEWSAFDDGADEGVRASPVIDWVIAGGESGPGARPCHPDWLRLVRDQSAAARVPFFFKQWGEWIDADQWLDIIANRSGIRLHFNGLPWEPKCPLSYEDAGQIATMTGCGRRDLIEHQSDGSTLIRTGKSRAGRLLDGSEHSEFPDDGPSPRIADTETA